MKRVMVNLDDTTGELFDQKIQAERRSASSYIVLLVEQDLRAAGLLAPVPTPDRKEVLAKVTAALEAKTVTETDLEKFLRNRVRKSRAA